MVIGPAAERRGALLRDAGVPVSEIAARTLLGPGAGAARPGRGRDPHPRSSVRARLGGRRSNRARRGRRGRVRRHGPVRRHDRAVRPRDRLRGARHRASSRAGSRCPSRSPPTSASRSRSARLRPTASPACRTAGSAPTATRCPATTASPSGSTTSPRHTIAYVARELPGLIPEPVEARSCFVTELPWGADGMAVWEPTARGSSPAATCSSTPRGSAARSPATRPRSPPAVSRARRTNCRWVGLRGCIS